MMNVTEKRGATRIIRKVCTSLALAGGLALAGVAPCFAETVALSWDPSTSSDVAGYKVYYAADSANAPFQGTGAAEGASPVDAKALTSATLSGLDPGKTYYFAITAYNSAGVESAYSTTVSIQEAVPPTVSLTSPSNATTASGTVSVTANASDNVGVTRVDFYLNGVLQGSDTSTPYLYSWNTAGLTAGSYTLMAKAYDAAGNVGQSGTVTVTVVNDTTPPVVSLTAPGNGATVSGTVALSASATDNVAVSKVEFYENNALLFASNVPPFSYGWNTTLVANGSHSLTAKAYDAVGNVGQSSTVAVTVFNDTTPPTVTAFTLPATATSTTVPVSSCTATDNSSVSGYLITESATAPAASAIGWSASAPASFTFAGTGSRTAYAWAKDAAGNVSASRSASVAISSPDATPPVATILSPANGAKVSSRNVVSASATDNVAVTSLQLYVDNSLKASTTSSTLSWIWYSRTYGSGAHTITVKAADAAGNIATRTITVYK